jgi:putative (di)nucleoside polyphosphate hydrolase
MSRGDSPNGSERLEELLADPIVWLVMRSDGVSKQEIAELVSSMCRKFGNDWGPSSQHASNNRGEAYRAGVGVMLLNARNEVWVGRRIGFPDDAWQMPQGGIDEGESPREAVFRELKEEIGTDNADILAETKDWLYYDLPADLIGKAWDGKWRGQRQKWFVMRFKGSDADVNLETEHPEFSAWKWVKVADLASLVVSFKRNVYLSLLAEFRDFVTPPDELPCA